MHELTQCEQLIMRAIWNAGESISTTELLQELQKDGKTYARTTLVTFLQRLADKGYIKSERRGRKSYITATKSKEEFLKQFMMDFTQFWCDGDKDVTQKLIQ